MKTVTELIGEAWEGASSEWKIEPEDMREAKALFYAAFSAGWRSALDYLQEAGTGELVAVLRGLRAELGDKSIKPH